MGGETMPNFIPEIRVAVTDEFMLALTEVLAGKLSNNAHIELKALDLQARIVRLNVKRCDHTWSICNGPRFCLKCNVNELPDGDGRWDTQQLDVFGRPAVVAAHNARQMFNPGGRGFRVVT
jgi:hypothetical protein